MHRGFRIEVNDADRIVAKLSDELAVMLKVDGEVVDATSDIAERYFGLQREHHRIRRLRMRWRRVHKRQPDDGKSRCNARKQSNDKHR